YDAERCAWVARQRKAEQQAMRAYASTTDCRMEFLQRQLDDEAAKPCGRCDNCAGPRFAADMSGERSTPRAWTWACGCRGGRPDGWSADRLSASRGGPRRDASRAGE
ncbi:RecQ family zinc-binding domain-containing protein, partial [Streptomyces afghaniensis]|uniref:RecQ family zinc-binding domain-containing protein n=1 Tax=Streptomyces afghaniensis TaxID=66865 RepID=UPI0024687A6B